MKNQLNNKKVWSFKGKITKSGITFRKYKPNFKNIKIGVNSFEISTYEILPAWRSKKQTQFKPNSNPIQERPKINLSTYFTGRYNNMTAPGSKKSNPIQTRFKPNFIFFLSQNYTNVHYIARTRIINNFLRCCYV